MSSVQLICKILSKFGQQYLFMMNYACAFSQSEMEKYFSVLSLSIHWRENKCENLNPQKI